MDINDVALQFCALSSVGQKASSEVVELLRKELVHKWGGDFVVEGDVVRWVGDGLGIPYLDEMIFGDWTLVPLGRGKWDYRDPRGRMGDMSDSRDRVINEIKNRIGSMFRSSGI